MKQSNDGSTPKRRRIICALLASLSLLGAVASSAVATDGNTSTAGQYSLLGRK